MRWLQALALGTIKFYQRFISPLLPSCCRYYPTCSTYSAESFARHGPFVGFWLSFKRILRCNPFFPGGYDPVPPRKPKAGQSPKRP
ncbi:MAG: membrane protein insertion efficiency factor YidD [Deltaproteobacteria bacterium]|nr:membrane protein insertion efficiency factor YidD [Deltaproteobacteria bacterium]